MAGKWHYPDSYLANMYSVLYHCSRFTAYWSHRPFPIWVRVDPKVGVIIVGRIGVVIK
jgi:hypothetical protein